MPYGSDPTEQPPSSPASPIPARVKADRDGTLRDMDTGAPLPPASPGLTVETAPQNPAPARSQGAGSSQLPGLNPDLVPIVARESRGNPNIGYGGVDLSNAPRDENGFPIWEGRMGPEGISHAAGIGQFQPGTWGPIAKKLGIHDFSRESQIKVANELYAEQGKAPWAASEPKGGGYGKDASIANGKWRVSPDALSAAQASGDVVYMSPDDYLGMLPEGRSQPRRSLRKMLEEGNQVD